MATKDKANEINITRIYDAPVKAVWDAWTDVKQVAKWWGPRGFTITTKSKDLRPGGKWIYTMHGPDGKNWPNMTTYHEVEKFKKLVYDHGATDSQPAMFRVTVLFSEVKGKTKMEMTMTMPSAEAMAETQKIIKSANGNSTWDRLAEYLEFESTGKEKFVINRSFDAPLALMFEVWSKPEHVQKWMPPTGMEMRYLHADIRPGGKSLYLMTGNGMKMYGRAEYLQIEKPGRLVYSQQFCDEKEKVLRHPMAPTFPETMLTTVNLVEEGPDRTRVTITWEPVGQFTREELETFVRMKDGMTQGWTGSFDKLEEYIPAAAATRT